MSIDRQYTKTAVIATLLFACLLFFGRASAQQFNNWYFVDSLGISFNTSPPSPIVGSAVRYVPNPVSMSDEYGKTLFYGNAVYVWDKLNHPMPNGYGLVGATYTWNHCTMTMPVIGSNTLYYIFTADGNVATNRSGGYCYSIVDMALNGGLGDVSVKNKKFFGPSAERLTIASHANGVNAWLLVKDIGKRYYSFLINCNGISSNPVVSTVGMDLDSIITVNDGDMKVSPDNKLMAVSYLGGGNSVYGNCVELFQFDNKTGILSNKVRIPVKRPLGIEFSPDSKKLYVSYDNPNTSIRAYYKIGQYDLSIYDSLHINGSGTVVGLMVDSSYELFGKGQGYLQLGPDKKIYHASFLANKEYNKLDVINKPDLLGPSCDVQFGHLIAGIAKVAVSNDVLPKGTTHLFVHPNAEIMGYEVLSNCRSVRINAQTYIKGNNLTFTWDFGDGSNGVTVVPSAGDTTRTSIVHNFPFSLDTFYVTLSVSSDTICGNGTSGKELVLTGFPLPPRPTAGFSYGSDCFSHVQFVDASQPNGNGPLTSRWFFGDGDSSWLQSPAHGYALAADSVQVTLIVQGSTGCALPDTLVQWVQLKHRPMAGLTVPQPVCGSRNAVFTDASLVHNNALLVKVYLLFGDGTMDSSGLFPSLHSYPGYDSFRVKYLVRDGNGCTSDTFYMGVATRAMPTVADIVYANDGCAGWPFALTGNTTVAGSSIVQYQWQAGSLSQNTVLPTASFVMPAGQQAVQLTALSAQGCTGSMLKNITVKASPLVSVGPVGGCVGQPVHFVSSITNASSGISSHQWLFGDGGTAAAATANHIYTVPGTYTAQFHAVSNEGCTSNTVSSTVEVDSYPVASFANTGACTGREVLFTNTSSNSHGSIASWLWQLGNGQTAATRDASAVYPLQGSYAVTLSAGTLNGCWHDTTILLPVVPIQVSAGHDTMVRRGDVFSLHGTGGTGYLWQPANLLGSAQTASPYGSLQQSQLFSLKVVDVNGCVGYDTVLVQVLPTLVVPNTFSPNGDGINDTWAIGSLMPYPNIHLQVFDRNGQAVHEQRGSYLPWNGTLNGRPLPVGTYYYIITTGADREITRGWVMIVR